MGHGGVKHVCEVSGVSPHTVIKGKNEIKDGLQKSNRQRATGGGRKKTENMQLEAWNWIKHVLDNSGTVRK